MRSWNSTLEWGLVGSKTQPKDKEMRTGQQTDLWLLFLCNLANAEMRSACTFFPNEAHAFTGGFYLLIHSGEPTKKKKKWKKQHSWIMLTDEKTLIYTCSFANIFSCLVNLGLVGTGQIFAFMAEVRIWWAVKMKRGVREMRLHSGVLKAVFVGFSFQLWGEFPRKCCFNSIFKKKKVESFGAIMQITV